MIAGDQRAFNLVKGMFKNDRGEPFEMTLGQIGLFRDIYEKRSPRCQFECYTQYGKSDVVSMAVALRSTTFPERWVILGGSKDKARIIMDKCIKHIFEHDYMVSKFEIGKDESIERIRRERSKDKMNFKVNERGDLGEVFILSAETRRKGQDAGDILIGHGAPNLIEDDSALIPDPIHGKALRMLGGHPKDNFLLKITNSFGRNHAWRSLNNPKYKSTVINAEQGIGEGRITREFVEEMRGELDPVMFGILYDCKHPPADLIDDSGWLRLVTEEEIEQAQTRIVEPAGEKLLGVDIGEGGNYNAFVIRQNNYAKVLKKTSEKNLMATADDISTTQKDERLIDHNIFIDAVGIGSGVVARCRQMKMQVNAVKAGEKPSGRMTSKSKEPARTELQFEKSVVVPEKNYKTDVEEIIEYANLRAEMYWKLKTWIRQGGALEPSKEWKQLSKVMYKIDGEKRIKIMPKEEMRARAILGLGESTDIPDALAFTFAPKNKRMVTTQATPPVAPYYPDIGI